MLKKILLGLVGLVLLLVAVGLLLPRKVNVKRTVNVKAPLGKIYPLVGNLRNWEKWSPWYKMEPTAELEYSANARGGMGMTGAGPGTDYKRAISGSWYTWKGNKIGEGKLTIMNALEDGIITKVEFKGMGTSQGQWSFEEVAADSYDVTWGFDTDLGMNPIARFMGLMMDGSLGKDFEAGLASIKELAESDSSSVPTGRPALESDADDSDSDGDGDAAGDGDEAGDGDAAGDGAAAGDAANSEVEADAAESAGTP